MGSRRTPSRGLELTAGIAEGLAANGFSIITGLAAGPLSKVAAAAAQTRPVVEHGRPVILTDLVVQAMIV